MITALLLPLFLIGAGAPTDKAVSATRSIGGEDPAIQIWINNDRRFVVGDRAKVQVRTREDGYLLVFHVDPDGHLRVLFPIDPRDDNFVRGGRKYEIRGRGGRESFDVDDGKGVGAVYAATSHDPFRFDQFVLGDHWDYRNLAPQRLPADPEPDLNDLVRRMVDGPFDYDILTYTVLERVVYADSYGSSYYDPYYYDGYAGCGYSYYGCGRSYYGSPYSLSIGLFFGRPYYRHSYFRAYDPFYDPFFYDPYYYRPFYQPYVYRPVYVRPYYNYPYSNYPYYRGSYPRYRVWDGPNTPYRFRPADGVLANYRNRGFDVRRSVNTVYLPPVIRNRQAANASPMRRLADDHAGVDARPAVRGRGKVDGVAARRASDRAPASTAERGSGRRVESRMEQPNVEARRAREPEQSRGVVPDNRDARGRRDLPTEVRPLSRSEVPARRAVERPQEARGSDPRSEPRVEARRAEPRPDAQPEFRPEARPIDRGSARGNDGRGTYSPPAQSNGGSRGGSGGGGSGGGGDRGGSMSGGSRGSGSMGGGDHSGGRRH